MYDELVKSLRVCGRMTSIDDNCISYVNGCCEAFPDCAYALMDQAADAIEELSRENKSLAASVEEAAEILRNRKPRWIPVTERLPEHDRNVLICYEWTGRSGTVYREVGIASIEELERDPTELFRPLYWMPLPEPPKEE